MSSVPDGRAANQPLAAMTFRPSIGALFSGARVSRAEDRLARERRRGHRFGRQLLQLRFLLRRRRRVDARVVRRAVLRFERAVVLAGILAGSRGDLSRQQRQNQAILVRRPDRAIPPQEARAGALFAAKANAALEERLAQTT